MATPEPMPRGEAPLPAEFIPEADFAPPAEADVEVGVPHLRLVEDHQLLFGQSLETVTAAHERQVEFHRRQLKIGNPMVGIHTEQYLMHSTLHKLAADRDIEGYRQERAEIHQRYLAQRALADKGE